jgi:hypothetical protein
LSLIESPIQSLNPQRPKPLRWLASRFVFAGASVWEQALLWLAAGLFLGFRFYRLTRYGLYTDEIFSVEAAHLSFGGLLSFVLDDVVHPPLFYLLLKSWIALGGESLLWLRLFPVMTSVLSIIPFLLLCRALRLKAAWTAAALWLAAVNPYLVYYSQELRMYSLAVLLSLCSAWLFVCFLNPENSAKRVLLALTVVNLLLVYTHYYGGLLIGAQGSYLFFRSVASAGSIRSLFPFSISSLAVALGFSPWAWFAWRSAAAIGGLGVNLGWNQPPTIKNLIQHFSLLSGPLDFKASTLIRVLLFGAPLVIAAMSEVLARRRNGPRRPGFWLLLTLVCVPVVVVFFVSQWSMQSGWLHRSLIVAAAPYFVLIPVAVAGLRPAWVKRFLMILILCWATASGVAGARRGEYGSAEGDKRRIAWESWARRLAETEAGRNVKVFAVDLHSAHTLSYYLHAAKDDRFEIHLLKGPGFQARYPVFAEREFAPATLEETVATGEDRFWIACRPENTELRQWLMEKGYRLENGPVVGIPGIQYELVDVSRLAR